MGEVFRLGISKQIVGKVPSSVESKRRLYSHVLMWCLLCLLIVERDSMAKNCNECVDGFDP